MKIQSKAFRELGSPRVGGIHQLLERRRQAELLEIDEGIEVDFIFDDFLISLEAKPSQNNWRWNSHPARKTLLRTTLERRADQMNLDVREQFH